MKQVFKRNHHSKRRIGIFLLCGLMLLSAAGLSASHTEDNVDSWAALMQAATNAHNAGADELIITITANISQDDSGGDDAFTVHESIKTITIHGGNFTIEGNGNDQIMRIGDQTTNKEKSITITDLTMKGGNALGTDYETKNGGALFVDGNATLSNCTFSDNAANASGGAVFVTLKADINGGDYQNNKAGGSGGAVLAITADIDGTNFSGNEAGEKGGAVYTVTADIDGGVYTNNSAGISGGAVFSGNADIDGTTFTGNKANEDGGAVLVWAGDAEIKNSEFTGNVADADNNGTGSGGAVYHRDDVVGTDNDNSSGTGGGSLTIADSEFYDNQVTTDGSNPTGGGSISSEADIVFTGDNYFDGNSGGADPQGSGYDQEPYGIESINNAPIDTTNANMIEGKKQTNAGSTFAGSGERISADTRGTEVYQGGGLASNATVYAEASQDSAAVGSVQAGAPIQLVRWGGGGKWCKIIYNGGNNSGWVQGKHIK